MPYYFMRDTPLQALEQLMMSQPGQKPRGGGIYRSPFHYTPKDVACEYCQNYVRKHPCRLCECTCLDERIEAGVLELNEFVRDCFAPSNVLRAMNMLWDFVHYQQVFKQSSLNIRRFNSEFENAFEGFLTFLKDSGYSDGSRRTFRSILFQFEEYLQNQRICKICEITEACLQNYVKTMSRFAPRTTARKLRLIKQWLEYCYMQGYLDKPLSFTIPRIHVPKNIELPTVFTREEVQKLLTSVDRSNPLGRRDYAILIMAAKLGLRVSDIINLTFDEIDWAKKTLSITQQKTGKLVELPLTEDVGWAIIDYLQNGRPESECIHVFIKHCAPYDGLNSNISKRLQKYLSKAEIKYPAGKTVGMHIFRRSLASAMLENGVPIAVISGTLGHTDPHSTETYLRIAIPQLRACALEVMD